MTISRIVTHHPQMLEDLRWWLKHDPELGRKVVELIEETSAHPESGHGRPKRLHSLPNVWSRRITHHHRLFYLLDGELLFISCRDHDMPQHIHEALRLEEYV